MTEQSTTEPTTETVEVPGPYREMVALNKQMLTAWANEANEQVRAVKSQENIETTIQDTIDNNDHETLAAYRQYVEEQEAALQAAYDSIRSFVTENLLPKDTDAVDPQAALEVWKEKKQAYDGLVSVMAKFPGFDKEMVTKLLSDVPTIENMGRHRGSKGEGGSGIRRPRVVRIRYREQGTENWTESFTVKGKGDNAEKVIGFTPLGANLRKAFGKVDDGQLRMEADQAAGTTEWVSLDGKPFSFYVSIPKRDNPEESTLVEVEVTPKAGKDNTQPAE